LGVIGSVESQFLELKLFFQFSAKCQIPDFLRSVPGARNPECVWVMYFGPHLPNEWASPANSQDWDPGSRKESGIPGQDEVNHQQIKIAVVENQNIIESKKWDSNFSKNPPTCPSAGWLKNG
jgi:hypothetical protein